MARIKHIAPSTDDPEAASCDIRARGWDEQIKAWMPLCQLTPAS